MLQSLTRLLKSAQVLIFIGLSLLSFNTSQAQDAAEKALEQNFTKATKKKDNKSAMNYALQLGELSLTAKKYEKAVSWYSKASKAAVQIKNYSGQFDAARGSGIAYLYLKNYAKAIDVFTKSVSIASEGKNKSNEATGLYLVALSEEVAGHNKKTIDPLEKALALAVELKNETLQLDCYLKLAENHKRLGDAKTANTYKNLYQQIYSARQSIEQQNQKLNELNKQVAEAKIESEQTSITLHEQEGKLLEQEEKLKRTADSLRQVEAINQANQLKIDLLGKEKELSELKIKEQKAELENDRLWRNSLIIGLALLAILGTVIIINYQNRLRANKQIHKQNENIKSSITYAKRIQEAMLPNGQALADFFPHSFVLFNPRDNVSGDFYWFTEIHNGHAENDLAFAAVDCTGHGVPGAFMSMVGMNSLNGIINRGIHSTDEMLSALHHEIRSSLRQPETGNNDGMDIALCIYKKDKKILEFSGAKNPAVYIQNNQLIQVKGDIHPIGGSKSKPQIAFNKHQINIDQPTMLYLFSDGYRDQFGGKNNSKFMSKKFNQLLLDIHQLPLQNQKEVLEKTIKEWKGQKPQTDDILVMGIRLIG